jgi:hypothetical protein
VLRLIFNRCRSADGVVNGRRAAVRQHLFAASDTSLSVRAHKVLGIATLACCIGVIVCSVIIFTVG